jgi:hypothetical protein
MNPLPDPARKRFSERWIVPLLDNRQTVVQITNGSESTAGVGPDCSTPKKAIYATISVLKKAASES